MVVSATAEGKYDVHIVREGDEPLDKVKTYDVAEDGTIANEREFFERWGDGMAVDQDGNVYVTAGESGVLVIAPDGTHLGSLVTGERTSNCTFGDDGSTLYVTSDMYLVRIRLHTTGVGF